MFSVQRPTASAILRIFAQKVRVCLTTHTRCNFQLVQTAIGRQLQCNCRRATQYCDITTNLQSSMYTSLRLIIYSCVEIVQYAVFNSCIEIVQCAAFNINCVLLQTIRKSWAYPRLSMFCLCSPGHFNLKKKHFRSVRKDETSVPSTTERIRNIASTKHIFYATNQIYV